MNTQNQSEISIGVDVGIANLDIAIYPLDSYFRIPNTREAIQKFLPLLKELDVKRIVVEATGRHEHPLSLLAIRQNYPFVSSIRSKSDGLRRL
jgi:transposase